MEQKLKQPEFRFLEPKTMNGLCRIQIIRNLSVRCRTTPLDDAKKANFFKPSRTKRSTATIFSYSLVSSAF